MATYSVTEEQKIRFAGIYLLEYMINTPHAIPIFLDGNDADLETILEWLHAKDYIQIIKNEKYIPTPEGRKLLEQFMARYSEYLTMFDIFSAVDLEAGEFAFAGYYDFETDAEWREFMDDDRWDDLRIAVADFKQMNPVEIVFMNFINEKRFGRDATGWQFDLLLGSVWDDILKICDTAIQWHDLGFEDEEDAIDAQDVIVDIIEQGTNIMLDLIEKENKNSGFQPFNAMGNGDVDDNSYVDRVDMPGFDQDHYKAYRDPNYRSSSWRNVEQ